MEFGDFVLVEQTAEVLEIAGAMVIAIGIAAAFVRAAVTRLQGRDINIPKRLRSEITRALLVGLELLVAADIISTVTLERTLEDVAALGLVVLIRTFLAWSILVEEEGRWPWQPRREPG